MDTSFTPPIQSIPTVLVVQTKMKDMTQLLYNEWKNVIAKRLIDFEFQGTIHDSDINVPLCVWKLPNLYTRSALHKLEHDLDTLGYEYKFTFDVDDEKTYSIHYVIELPDETDENNEENLVDLEKGKESNTDINYKSLLDKISSMDDDSVFV